MDFFCPYGLACFVCDLFFFFNDTATTELYTLSLHDALPIRRGPPIQFCSSTSNTSSPGFPPRMALPCPRVFWRAPAVARLYAMWERASPVQMNGLVSLPYRRCACHPALGWERRRQR